MITTPAFSQATANRGDATRSFFLESGSRRHALFCAYNVSVTGANLVVDARLKVGDEVLVTYTDEICELSLRARVVGACNDHLPCQAVPSARELEVRFDCVSADEAMLLFMALREHLNSFH
jgi:hypothetical protein